jgi:hypothetical protein
MEALSIASVAVYGNDVDGDGRHVRPVACGV